MAAISQSRTPGAMMWRVWHEVPSYGPDANRTQQTKSVLIRVLRMVEHDNQACCLIDSLILSTSMARLGIHGLTYYRLMTSCGGHEGRDRARPGGPGLVDLETPEARLLFEAVGLQGPRT